MAPKPPPTDDAEDALYLVALDVETDEELSVEMREWESATIADGLTP